VVVGGGCVLYLNLRDLRTTVTIQLEPAYQLHAVEVPMTLEAVLSSLNTIIHSAGTSTFSL
jgi:hypothetical protein